jgi:hypothetical protein
MVLREYYYGRQQHVLHQRVQPLTLWISGILVKWTEGRALKVFESEYQQQTLEGVVQTQAGGRI